MPRLAVQDDLRPGVLCGVPRPAGTGDRTVLRIEIDARPAGDEAGCPMTIDLYRTASQVIDGVVVYTAKDVPDGMAVAPAGLRPARGVY
jgi:hypothetical protein